MLQLCRNLQCRYIQFETDCNDILRSWKSGRPMASYFYVIVQECKMLAHNFEDFQISHVKREANKAADFMSRLASLHIDRVWFDAGPVGLNSIISNDLCISPVDVE